MRKKKVLAPAELVTATFGGVRAAGRAIGVDPSTVCRWNQSQDMAIKEKYHKAIIKEARKLGVFISPIQLMSGKIME